MNYIPQIAKMLGVEIGERFEVDSGDHAIGLYYYFSDTELLEHRKNKTPDYAQYRVLADLIYGDKKVIKLPFEPKYGDRYYYVYFIVNDRLGVLSSTWRGETGDYLFKLCDNCFRTKEEAESKKYSVYKRLTGKEWG